MGSSSRFLELKLMGCKGLQAFNFFQKLKVFAVVSLTTDKPGNKQQQQQQQRTKTDTEGDKDPEWNQELRFDLNSISRDDFDHLYLHIDLRYEFFGDKSLGDVRVPITDLVGDSSENCGEARFVSYEIRNHERKPNGFITFSYKVVGDSATATVTKMNSYGHVDGYTVVHHVDDHHRQSNHDQNTGGYGSVNHGNSDFHQQQQQNLNLNQHHHNDDHEQHLQQSRPDQDFSYQYSASVESSEYRIQYPSVETPPYLPTPAREGYSMSYSRLEHHQFQYPPPPHPPSELQSYPFPPPPPPPFHPHPEFTRIQSDPFPPPQPPHPEFSRMQSDPFPPPQPPFPHHHHHHLHVGHEAAYPPPATGDPYEHSYGISRRIYFNEDGTPRY